MKTNTHFLSNLAQFFLEWKMLQANILEKIKHTFHVSITLKKNLALFQIMRKNIVELRGYRQQYGAYALHAG
jgi:hypothetical protein